MAIWQWEIWMVPTAEVVRRFEAIPEHLDLGVFESIGWWLDVSDKHLVTFFNDILPNYETPWAANTQSWGSDDGDRIELTVENLHVTDVAIRIDLRSLNFGLLRSLVDFASENRFLFFELERERFIDPNFAKLLKAIEGSPKMTFITDPRKLFEDEERLSHINRKIRDTCPE